MTVDAGRMRCKTLLVYYKCNTEADKGSEKSWVMVQLY